MKIAVKNVYAKTQVIHTRGYIYEIFLKVILCIIYPYPHPADL